MALLTKVAEGTKTENCTQLLYRKTLLQAKQANTLEQEQSVSNCGVWHSNAAKAARKVQSAKDRQICMNSASDQGLLAIHHHHRGLYLHDFQQCVEDSSMCLTKFMILLQTWLLHSVS